MGSIKIKGAEIPLKEQNIADCNVLEVKAGTTGWCGHTLDCKTYLSIRDAACTNMYASVDTKGAGSETGVQILLEGETELITFMCALKFALDTLTEKAKETIPGFNLDNAYEARTKVYDLGLDNNDDELPF